MLKEMRVEEMKSVNLVNGLKKKILNKKRGDGHYVAVAVTIVIALIIGGLVYTYFAGDNGYINTILGNITSKITSFVQKITG